MWRCVCVRVCMCEWVSKWVYSLSLLPLSPSLPPSSPLSLSPPFLPLCVCVWVSAYMYHAWLLFTQLLLSAMFSLLEVKILYSIDMPVFTVCLCDSVCQQVENEENVLVCLKVIIELHKQFRPSYSPEVSVHDWDWLTNNMASWILRPTYLEYIHVQVMCRVY